MADIRQEPAAQAVAQGVHEGGGFVLSYFGAGWAVPILGAVWRAAGFDVQDQPGTLIVRAATGGYSTPSAPAGDRPLSTTAEQSAAAYRRYGVQRPDGSTDRSETGIAQAVSGIASVVGRVATTYVQHRSSDRAPARAATEPYDFSRPWETTQEWDEPRPSGAGEYSSVTSSDVGDPGLSFAGGEG